MPGWKTDDYVPFMDTESGVNIYPIQAQPLPLEWNLTGNINADNYHEHLPFRNLDWYPAWANVTSNAAYFMQGMCNPQILDPTHPGYYPECTVANNDMLTGGIVQPTDTNYYIANKAKDLVWMLKPIYEMTPLAKSVGIYFANDGAGSTVRYPARAYDGTDDYTSIGCDWMQQIHPRTNRSVGTPEQIARCHLAGASVNGREYNPLERAWCKEQVERDIAVFQGDQALPESVIDSLGPYLDALSQNDKNVWVVTFGQAVFDMLTNEFIACTLFDVSLTELYNVVNQAASFGNTTKSALIRWNDEGDVIVASNWNPRAENTTVTVTDPMLDLGVDSGIYSRIRNLVDYESVWDPMQTSQLYHKTILQTDTKLIMMHPVPSIPDTYEPLYRPKYMVLISMEKWEAYGVLTAMEVLIQEDTYTSGKEILIVGAIGFGVIIFFVSVISGSLTKPLRWMQKVSGTIVDSCGGTELGQGLLENLDVDEAKPCWSPKTEVTLLLSEFVKMIHGFSGDGAAEVAGADVNEVKNNFEWRKMYVELYPWGKDADDVSLNPDGTPKQISINKNDSFEDELTTDSTQWTDRSIFSVLSSSVAGTKYGPTVQAALTQTSSLLMSVKESAVMLGARAGILKEPEREKVEGPPKVNLGENITSPKDPLADYFDGVDSAENSYLFWWTTFFIGTPIVVAAIMIAVTVASDAEEFIPKWLNVVKEKSIDIELNALILATKSRAYFVSHLHVGPNASLAASLLRHHSCAIGMGYRASLSCNVLHVICTFTLVRRDGYCLTACLAPTP
jgi:hypothetical protein